jgi:hypothetical protein
VELFLDISMIILASTICYQDVKTRLVHLILLVGFIGLLAFKAVWETSYIEVLVLERLINLIILSLTLLLVWIYFKFIRKKRFLNVIGMGDILVFLAFVIAYEANTFIIHLTLSLIFSLLLHFIFKNNYKKKDTIPLAGFMCIYFIGVLLMERFHILIPFNQ